MKENLLPAVQENWDFLDLAAHSTMEASVNVVAHIRENATGEVVEYPTTEHFFYATETHPNVFNSPENNFACDCNRRIFFYRAKGRELTEEEDEMECSHGSFSVNLLNPKTGLFYYQEF